MGAVIVSFIQFTLIYLIIRYEMEAEIAEAKSYLIIIPRFISSLMMHLQIEGATRSGLNIMKFVVNHPEKFKGYITKDGNPAKVLAPFMAGFSQALIGFTVEFAVLVQLSTLTNFLIIIIQFASMAAITTFDSRYAHAVFADKMNNAAGKMVKRTHYRCMNGFDDKSDYNYAMF